ncbi:NAC domain-containing protein 102-like [Impatiens glandulifera]|uniref:NAC domain-containing protein 102-like n=1 Tax=Impatiens glandulifera TaxID=253017 RepID=UPI001FB084C0|nr:NAC domain-containing protein 102-like [Impatiens glandulifera]
MEGPNESECLVPIGVPNGSQLFVPKYFRFKPKDDELISDFLLRKSKSLPLDVDVIAEVDIYKFNPWELPKMALYCEKDWYFFTLRNGKQPNMVRPNRLAGIGFRKNQLVDARVLPSRCRSWFYRVNEWVIVRVYQKMTRKCPPCLRLNPPIMDWWIPKKPLVLLSN